MRIKLPSKPKPAVGEQRVKHGFLFLPMMLPNFYDVTELRWLRRESWYEEYTEHHVFAYDGAYVGTVGGWVETRWLG